jgi:Zn-dependent peptidase ImmA (M78 family)
MNPVLSEISDLAEHLGQSSLIEGRADLEKLADAHNVKFIRGHYGNYFIGLLFYFEQNFYIVLNQDQLDQCESGRLRFTIAHELGHYFIPSHRARMEEGISLSFNKSLEVDTQKRIEYEANLFAANLLMPKKHFCSKISTYNLGLSGILNLKKDYDTSIECTVNHFINQDMSAVLMIKWKADFSYQYLAGSVSFWKKAGIKKSDFSIRFDSTYVENQVNILKNPESEISATTSKLSKWAFNSSANGQNDVELTEEMIKLGNYGGLVLLTLF